MPPKNLADALEAISGLESELTAAQALIAEQEPVSAQLAQVQSDFAAQGVTLTEAQAEVSRLNTEIESLRAATPSNSEQAAAIVASIGIPEVSAAQDEQATKSHSQIFAELKGPEKTAYFREHAAAIRAGK